MARPLRGWAIGIGLAATLATMAAGARYGPALVLAVTLATPSAETWLAYARQAPDREDVQVVTGRGRALAADLYRPPRVAGALLLVHGLSRAGRRQPELARLARALAGQGQLVLVPQFDGLAGFRLSGHEVDDVRAALSHLRQLSPASAGIAGFSFGAGPALLAAAGSPGLRLVGAFGGYADLRHVITFVTTGAHRFEEREYRMHQDAYNRWKLLALLLGFVEDARQRALLQAIADRKLANPADATSALDASLDREGRAVLALVLNERPDAVPFLMGALPSRARDAMGRLSPLPAMARVSGRLLIAHGADDESIPFTESLRLAAAAGARAVILQGFHHVGPTPGWPLPPRALDGARLLGLADGLLRP